MEGRSRQPILAYLYKVIEADSNGDSRLTRDDLCSLAVSDPGGTGYSVLLTGIEQFHGHRLLSSATVVVLYTSSSELRAAELDIDKKRVIRNEPVSSRE